MLFRSWFSLSKILDESPFFTELSIRERERLIAELLQSYPQLNRHESGDSELGYEASWFMKQVL